jgi:hypothetical protein
MLAGFILNTELRKVGGYPPTVELVAGVEHLSEHLHILRLSMLHAKITSTASKTNTAAARHLFRRLNLPTSDYVSAENPESSLC